MIRQVFFALFLVLSPVGVHAQDFTLSIPNALQENGFMQFLLPRFSLKTRVRPEMVSEGESADARLNITGGMPVMQGLGQRFYLTLDTEDPARRAKAERFRTWLTSDIGRRTIEQFEEGGTRVFTAAVASAEAEEAVVFNGDQARGETLSFTHCGRCHVVGPRNRMAGIGSTPSFALLRALPDWQDRFQTFYVRIPHPSIIQIKDVSIGFSEASPPANHPVYLTTDQVEDILTYVATIAPADLGAPLAER